MLKDRACFVLTLFSFIGIKNGLASVPAEEYVLPWPTPREQLVYHSCGCADGCWVAEVRIKKSQRIVQRLSCDCESLFYTESPRKAAFYDRTRKRLSDCAVINMREDKFSAITKTLRQQRSRKY